MSKTISYVCGCDKCGGRLDYWPHGIRDKGSENITTGFYTEQEKSMPCCQTVRGNSFRKDNGKASAADQAVVAMKPLKDGRAKGLAYSSLVMINNRKSG
jgi:hypothetical protein